MVNGSINMFYTLFYTFDAVDVDEKLNTCRVFRKLSLELLQTQMYDKWRRKLDNVSANNEFERRIFTITSAVISKNWWKVSKLQFKLAQFAEVICIIQTHDGHMDSNFEEYNENDDIGCFLERLSQYCIAVDIKIEGGTIARRKAILVDSVGKTGYKTLNDLCYPETPNDKTYEQLSTLLTEHYSPKKEVVAERFKFH